ncbi:MAG: hypothetical protein C5B49_11575 [Bdellovibrio sp.]|nr:MAG: hypothetical protein C5B49_11575 [Bdellovibrio sp.]
MGAVLVVGSFLVTATIFQNCGSPKMDINLSGNASGLSTVSPGTITEIHYKIVDSSTPTNDLELDLLRLADGRFLARMQGSGCQVEVELDIDSDVSVFDNLVATADVQPARAASVSTSASASAAAGAGMPTGPTLVSGLVATLAVVRASGASQSYDLNCNSGQNYLVIPNAQALLQWIQKIEAELPVCGGPNPSPTPAPSPIPPGPSPGPSPVPGPIPGPPPPGPTPTPTPGPGKPVKSVNYRRDSGQAPLAVTSPTTTPATLTEDTQVNLTVELVPGGASLISGTIAVSYTGGGVPNCQTTFADQAMKAADGSAVDLTAEAEAITYRTQAIICLIAMVMPAPGYVAPTMTSVYLDGSQASGQFGCWVQNLVTNTDAYLKKLDAWLQANDKCSSDPLLIRNVK